LKITATIVALLAFAGCSATNSLSPQPGITQGPVESGALAENKLPAACTWTKEEILPPPCWTQPDLVIPETGGCQKVRDAVDYTKFVNRVYVKIDAPSGMTAYSANVYNAMSNGMHVRGGDLRTKHVYVPGHAESFNGWQKVAFESKHGHTYPAQKVVMRAVASPTSGYVRINIRWCQ
jgi:hypothetical protein